MRFFNSLRRSSTGKYLLYAMGEIVLVVIGILIALQINNWNDYRKDREQEKLYLTSLKSDLKDSMEELERVIIKTDEVAEAARELLYFSREEAESLDPELIDSLLLKTFGYTIAMTNEGTIQDIQGSGDLKVIQNDSIRKLIGSWEAGFKLIRERENLSKTSFYELKTSLDQIANLHGYRKLNEPLLTAEQRIKLLRSIVFQNFMVNTNRDASVLNDLYKEKYRELENILEMLKKVEASN